MPSEFRLILKHIDEPGYDPGLDCYLRHGGYEVPSRTRIRDVLTRVDPEALDRALQGWNAQMAAEDEGLALDGKTMGNALDADGKAKPFSS